MLTYFCFNFFVLTMSTIRVFLNKMEPVKQVRFLIAFPLPWSMPQFLTIGPFPDWAVHLSFRVYSMMFTTTIIGLILARLLQLLVMSRQFKVGNEKVCFIIVKGFGSVSESFNLCEGRLKYCHQAVYTDYAYS